MHWRECLRIGVNHHLLHAGGIEAPARHAETLLPLLGDSRFEVVDLWIPAEAASAARELAACRDSGKLIVYNIGGRKGQPSPQPAALDPAVWQRSLDFYREELDRALAAGATRVVTNSGADQPAAREAAREQLVRFYQVLCRHVPPTVTILIEPTDRTLDKRKLIGPSAEAAALGRRLRAEGCANFASMVDMGHVPLLGETLAQAFQDSADCLGHIHLGNCILRNPQHPLFGDKHVP
jgi:sugar phosphate isomerase/epimerase